MYLLSLWLFSLLTPFVSALPIIAAEGDYSRVFHSSLRARQGSDIPSGLELSDNPADWPDEATLKRVLASKPNKAFFWTGQVAGVSMEGRALAEAKKVGGNTLEGTMAAAGIKMPHFNNEDALAEKIWVDASNAFAQQASGDAFVVMGTSLRPGNVFETSELPELKRNRRVNRVIKINGLTGKRTTIFNRNPKKTAEEAAEAEKRRNACGAPPPATTIPNSQPKLRRNFNGHPQSNLEHRQVPQSRAQRRKEASAPACPLPGEKQQKKVVPRSSTTPKRPPPKSFAASKPPAKAPTPKRKTPRPPNRPKRAKGAAAPPRKRITPTKKPKRVPKPASKPRGKPRRRR